MTGTEFYALLQQKYDKAYSGYLDVTKANRLIKESVFNLTDALYRGLSIQKEFDELWSMIAINEEVSVSGTPGASEASFDLSTLAWDYNHLFRVAMQFENRIFPTYATTTGYFSLTKHNLRPGDKIRLKNGDNDGDYDVDVVKNGKFKLSATLTGAIGEVYVVTTSEATPYFSDRKKSVFGTPTVTDPKYQISFVNGTGGPPNRDKSLKLYPAPQKMFIDYMTLPPIDIDCADNSIDLVAFYTEKFLYRLAEECVKSFAEQSRDYNLKQSAVQTIIDNP